jgi:hypothetical protein
MFDALQHPFLKQPQHVQLLVSNEQVATQSSRVLQLEA